MKRIVILCFVFISVLLTGCREKTFTVQYTIGCMGYHTSPNSDWAGFEEYISSKADYNKIVSYTVESFDESDLLAAEYFNTELAKIDNEKACSFIGEADFLTYGIARTTQDGNAIVVKSVTFTANGVE